VSNIARGLERLYNGGDGEDRDRSSLLQQSQSVVLVVLKEPRDGDLTIPGGGGSVKPSRERLDSDMVVTAESSNSKSKSSDDTG